MLLAALLPVFLAGSCRSLPDESFTPGELRDRLAEEAYLPNTDAEPVSYPAYTLMPGDEIDVLYNLEYRITGEDYKLDILDQLQLTVPHHDEVNGTYVIRPDGKISLPHRGSVRVVGMTMDQLTEQIREWYSEVFRDPEVILNLVQFGARIEELKNIISSDRRGQVFEAKIRPDGYITLPIVGDLLAAGSTARQLNDTVSSAYESHYRGIQVTTIIQSTPSNVFYVLGEVEQPGQFSFSRPRTVSQALAMAGVIPETAGLATVIVVNTGGSTLVGHVVDAEGLFDGSGGTDMFLSRDDVVFVPKNRIAHADLFVQQYIEQLLLFRGSSFSYSVGRRAN